jgi:lipopolysaccharide heptosyltransferase II
VGSAALLNTARRGRRDDPPPPVRTILVVRLDLLGDIIFTEPLVRGLRAAYPGARILWVTLPYTAPLARAYRVADEVIELDSNRVRSLRGLLHPATWRAYLATFRLLRGAHPDLAVSVAGRTASLVALISGAPRRIGYLGEAYRWSLTDGIDGGRYDERQHEVEYVRALAALAGVRGAPDRLHAPLAAADRATVDRMLSDAGINSSDTVVVIHAGALNGSAKRWPATYWSRFADDLNRQANARVVLAGARSDEPLARQVQVGAHHPVVSLVGRTSIGELAALIGRADLVATGDSGPLHLAVALGRPLVAAYGPTDPQVHGPYHPSAPVRIHRADLPCSPCYSMTGMADCPLGDPTCMKLVSVRTMVDSALELLTRPPD